jgi:hypothetical protein
MNELSKYANIFDAIPKWRGIAPPGYTADFLGALTAKEFVTGVGQMAGARSLHRTDLEDLESSRQPPVIGDGHNGERWFEAVNWIVATSEAKNHFVMASLGAFYGYQAVRSVLVLRLLNPMPYKVVCVEPLADKMMWVRRHMRDNAIDPDHQWLIEAAIGNSNDPVLFPVGAPTIGGHNCVATNESSAREDYLRTLLAQGRAEQALSDLLLRNSTGILKDLAPGKGLNAEIRFVSCITLADVLGPFNFVDYVEADIQQSEVVVFPSCMDVLRQKVRRLHIGTHGVEVHNNLHVLFAERGWEIVFSYLPDSEYNSPFGPFTTGDGVLTVRNPDL